MISMLTVWPVSAWAAGLSCTNSCCSVRPMLLLRRVRPMVGTFPAKMTRMCRQAVKVAGLTYTPNM